MNGVRDTERGGLLRKILVLVSLLHCKAPRLFSSVLSNKKLCRSIDIPIAWTWAGSDEAEHALNCSPVVTRSMIVGEMRVDRLSRCGLPGLGRSALPEQMPRPLVSRDIHL